MKEYKVGQILYLLSGASTNIIPVQIIEEVIRTTISGQDKTYTVQLPDKQKTTADINDIKGELFDNPELLKSYMIQNANDAIDKIIKNSIDLSCRAFNVDSNDINISEMDTLPLGADSVQNKEESDIIKVDLGNGQFANMKAENLKNLENMWK